MAAIGHISLCHTKQKGLCIRLLFCPEGLYLKVSLVKDWLCSLFGLAIILYCLGLDLIALYVQGDVSVHIWYRIYFAGTRQKGTDVILDQTVL